MSVLRGLQARPRLGRPRLAPPPEASTPPTIFISDLAWVGQWATVGKVVVFIVLILGGVWAFGGRPLMPTLRDGLTPFLPFGAAGLFLQAMGYTLIALQGFDLIAAVGGEVKNPGRNLPRAMLLSLGAALRGLPTPEQPALLDEFRDRMWERMGRGHRGG